MYSIVQVRAIGSLNFGFHSNLLFNHLVNIITFCFVNIINKGSNNLKKLKKRKLILYKYDNMRCIFKCYLINSLLDDKYSKLQHCINLKYTTINEIILQIIVVVLALIMFPLTTPPLDTRNRCQVKVS